MKKDKSEINYGKTLFVIAMLLCIGTICVLVFGITSPQNSSASTAKNITNNSAVLPIENINSSDQPPSTEEPSRITHAKAMLQAYNDFEGAQFNDNGLDYFERLYDIGWNETSFFDVMSKSSFLAASSLLQLENSSGQNVFLNMGTAPAQTPEFAKTAPYRLNGQYGVIIDLHLEQSPAVTTPVQFWERDYAYPVSHEMRHVKRFFESGIFNASQASANISSDELYGEYLNRLLVGHNMSSLFYSNWTAENLDELDVALETDNPKEIALNIDRLNGFTMSIFENDKSEGMGIVAPYYLKEIVLARHLSQAYAKPSVQRQNYAIRDSAFGQMENFSASVRAELYKTYPNDTDAIQTLETIYEQDADQAINENSE